MDDAKLFSSRAELPDDLLEELGLEYLGTNPSRGYDLHEYERSSDAALPPAAITRRIRAFTSQQAMAQHRRTAFAPDAPRVASKVSLRA